MAGSIDQIRCESMETSINKVLLMWLSALKVFSGKPEEPGAHKQPCAVASKNLDLLLTNVHSLKKTPWKLESSCKMPRVSTKYFIYNWNLAK